MDMSWYLGSAIKAIAKSAYEVYHDHRPHTEWDNLTHTEQERWVDVVRVVASEAAFAWRTNKVRGQRATLTIIDNYAEPTEKRGDLQAPRAEPRGYLGPAVDGAGSEDDGRLDLDRDSPDGG